MFPLNLDLSLSAAVEQVIPLKVNLINWPANRQLRYNTFSTHQERGDTHRADSSTEKKPKKHKLSNSKRDASLPYFFTYKKHTSEDATLLLRQSATVWRTYRKIQESNKSADTTSEEPAMLEESTDTSGPEFVSHADLEKDFQAAKNMDLNLIVSELEKELAIVQEDCAAGKEKLVATINSQFHELDRPFKMLGLDYLIQGIGSKPRQEQADYLISTELSQIGQSLRTFLPTKAEESFIHLLDTNQSEENSRNAKKKKRGPSAHDSKKGGIEVLRNLFQDRALYRTGNQSYKELHKTNDPRNTVDASMCQICNRSEDGEGNPILYCSQCSITVHLHCYQIESEPAADEDWTCLNCVTFGEAGRLLACGLCTRRGGAMHPTTLRATGSLLDSLQSSKYCLPSHSPNSCSCKMKETGVSRPLIGSEAVLQKIKQDELKEPEFYAKLQYNYHKEPHDYTRCELANAPRPQVMWVHWSCSYWVPYADLLRPGHHPENAAQLDTRRFRTRCLICGQSKILTHPRGRSLRSVLCT